jgi:hypothetical protein
MAQQDVTWLSRVQCGSVRMRRCLVQGEAWLSSGFNVDQFRVRHSSVQGAAWLAEIFAAQGAPPVSLTLVANGKIFTQKSFHYFFWTSLGSRVSR